MFVIADDCFLLFDVALVLGLVLQQDLEIFLSHADDHQLAGHQLFAILFEVLRRDDHEARLADVQRSRGILLRNGSFDRDRANGERLLFSLAACQCYRDQ